MFRYGLLLAALETSLAGRRFPSDEAQALEWQGHGADADRRLDNQHQSHPRRRISLLAEGLLGGARLQALNMKVIV